MGDEAPALEWARGSTLMKIATVQTIDCDSLLVSPGACPAFSLLPPAFPLAPCLLSPYSSPSLGRCLFFPFQLN
jgi:hypothetical protein